jgi:hypothetical protein
MPCPRARCIQLAGLPSVIRSNLKDSIRSGAVDVRTVTPCEGDLLYADVASEKDTELLNALVKNRVPWTTSEVTQMLVRQAFGKVVGRVDLCVAAASMEDVPLFSSMLDLLDTEAEFYEVMRHIMDKEDLMKIAQEGLRLLRLREDED